MKRALAPLRAVGRAAAFFLKVFPMLPSQPVDWVTPTPMVERVRYPTRDGFAEGDLYRPPGSGPYPGIVVCLGVVPFEVDHPQVPVLGRALAHAGIAALLYWSPAMRDFRLVPEDVQNIALAYEWLIQQPCIDPRRSGLLGTCVGGSFALMAAADPLIASRVGFVSAYAPFSSMWTLARDIAGSARTTDHGREPWKVDPLTRKVFVHSLTGWLDPAEATLLREAFTYGKRTVDTSSLSSDEGQAALALLAAQDDAEADAALQRIPAAMQRRFDAISPLNTLSGVKAPLIVLLHDYGDQVIPVSESRQLRVALDGRSGVQYTEMHFSHLDPVKGRLPLASLVRELGKFFLAVYPIFRQAESG